MNVSDIDWSSDSSELVSSSYDMTCKVWDVATGKLSLDIEAEGFVQCVMFNPEGSVGNMIEEKVIFCSIIKYLLDSNLLFHGTSRNLLTLRDKRQSSNSLVITNDAMINSIYVYRDGSYILSGDSSGFLKTWDIRTGKPVYISLNENAKKPISCITTCRSATRG